MYSTTTKGGVEDTRLEAKAKDTKKSEAKAKDSPSDDRHSRGQGQGPRTRAQVFSSPKKVFKTFFKRSPVKTPPKIFFLAIWKISTSQKKALSSSRGQGNFRGLDLLGQGQGLQNVSSRPRTSSRTPPLTTTMNLVKFVKKHVPSLNSVFL